MRLRLCFVRKHLRWVYGRRVCSLCLMCLVYLSLMVVFQVSVEESRLAMQQYYQDMSEHVGRLSNGNSGSVIGKFWETRPPDFRVKGEVTKPPDAKSIQGSEDDTSRCNHSAPGFQHVHRGLYVFSGYWDSRQNDFDNLQSRTYARIMAMIPKRLNLVSFFCIFHSNSSVYNVSISGYRLNEHHNRQIHGYILSCLVPEKFEERPCTLRVQYRFDAETAVNVTMQDMTVQKRMHQFGLCIPPLFGEINPVYLIEFMELSAMLGVNHVTLYNYSIEGEVVPRIIQYYAQHQRATVLNWSLPLRIRNDKIWYNGQMVAIQDCMYRYMGRANAVAFNDLDEFMVPRDHQSWDTFLHTLPELVSEGQPGSMYCGYKFASAFLKPKPQTSDSPILLTQRSVRRTKLFNHIRSKNIVLPHLIFEKGIHHISKPIWAHLQTLPVDTERAFLYHYRNCVTAFSAFTQCNATVPDYTLHIYSKALETRVRLVAQEVKLKLPARKEWLWTAMIF